jgi:hypothetical protein
MTNHLNMFIEGEEEQVETQEVDTTEQHEETHNEAEETTDDSTEENSERRTETPEAKRARLKRQLEQLDKKHGFKDQEGDKKLEVKEAFLEGITRDDFNRLQLKTEGIKDRGEQEIVLEYAKWKKIDPVDALNSAAVKAELREYRERSSTPAPSTRTASPSKGVEYWVRQVEAGKANSDDPKIRAQVRTILQKKLT